MNGRPQPHPQPQSTPPTLGTRTTSYNRTPFKPRPYTQAETERIQGLLDQLLGPEYVSSRPGGGAQVQYLEGWRSLNLANEVFGFNGWNSELVSCTVDFLDSHPAGKFSIGVSVVVRVTLKDGTYREDFGYGSSENCRSKAAAFEKVKKEAYTDGLKRCFRCFGNLIGNCLYDKDISRKIKQMKVERREYTNEQFFREKDEAKREKERMETMKVSLMEGQGELKKHSKVNGKGNLDPQQGERNHINERGSKIGGSLNSGLDDTARNDLNGTSVHGGNINTRSSPKRPSNKYIPSAEDMEMLDESFFSDMDDEFSQDIQQPVSATMPPTQMRFVSARGAEAIQKNPEDTNVPVFDLKFIAPGVKRTVDPTVSAPVKNSSGSKSDANTSINGSSAGNSTTSPSTSGNIATIPPNTNKIPSVVSNGTLHASEPMGRRIGMPPSQRTLKRKHLESDVSFDRHLDSS